MKKRTIILTITGALLLCAVAVFLFFKKTTTQEHVSMKTIHAVPVDALFFCYIDRLDILNETLNNESSNWKIFADSASPMMSLLRNMEKAAAKNKTVAEVLRSETVISAHMQGKEEITYLWITALPASVSEDNWVQFLKTMPKAIQAIAYQQHTIYTIDSEQGILYCAMQKGLSLCSRSLITLQSAVRQLDSGVSITNEEEFAAVLGTVGTNVDVRFFLNHHMIQKIWPLIGNKDIKKYGAFLSKTANWTALDGQVMPNMLHLSGFIFPSFTDDNYLSLILSQQGASISAWDFLPAGTTMMLSIGIKDISRFYAAQAHYMEVQKKQVAYQQALAGIEEKGQRKADDFFAALYPEELAVANVPAAGWLNLIRSGNTKYALEQFREMAEKIGMKNFKATGLIYRNPAEGLLSALFGEAYSAAGDRYFTIHNDWIVFADSLQLLANFTPQQNNLKSRMQEMQATQYITSNASFVACMQSSQNNEALLSLLNPTFRQVMEKGLSNNPSGITCLQMRPMHDKIYANLYTYFSEEIRTEEKTETPKVAAIVPQTLPEKTEEKPAVQKKQTKGKNRLAHLFEIKNHYTNEQESFVQYTDNSIALLNSKGGTLWDKKMDGAIIDTVIQIDFFKNKKLQMLFTTGNQLYLLDRNGETVAPFPLPMQTKAICGVAVFDYAKDRDYRIFLAHADNTIRAYDKKGRALSGFKTFKTKHQPVRAPEFVRAGGRDYIVVFDAKEVYILDRQGNVRTDVQSSIAVEPRAPIEVQQSSATIKVTTTKGAKMEIGLRDGKVTSCVAK